MFFNIFKKKSTSDVSKVKQLKPNDIIEINNPNVVNARVVQSNWDDNNHLICVTIHKEDNNDLHQYIVMTNDELSETLTTKHIIGINTSTDKNDTEERIYVESKQSAKHKAKNNKKRKFVIGRTYLLRTKSKDNSKEAVKEFVLKKFIYTVNENIVNSLVLKQVSGINNAIFTLNREDCKRLHIKYEPGLQVFPMEMNWIEKK